MVQGPDGTHYRTVSRLAAACRCSTDRLRRLDDVLKPVRVADVFPPGRALGRGDLPGSARLYPYGAAFASG